MTRKQRKTLVRIIIAAFLTVFAALLKVDGALKDVLFLIPYMVAGYDILLSALSGIKNRQPFDENFLMAVATVGAMILGEYAEGVAVMIFYQTGELFQSYAVGKSRRAIGELMDIRPDYANIVGNDGALCRVEPDEVEIGTIIEVSPGEKIPIDGVVVSGESSLDTSALTGESFPRDVRAGDEVKGGCINLCGVLRVKTTHAFGESTVSKILELVENASAKKARSEKFISRFARYYTPAVCGLALAIAVIPPFINGLILNISPLWEVWVYRALTFLVISCPCALVISIPLSFFAAIGGAGRVGILIKGSNYIEALANVKCVMFDKTGTLTCGRFQVEGVYDNKIDEKALLYYAAAAESRSSHPISRCLQDALPAGMPIPDVSDIREIVGHGVTANVNGVAVSCGNVRLMEKLGIKTGTYEASETSVFVALDGELCGRIEISDAVKPDARDAVARLYRTGVYRCVMLTGDTKRVGEKIAAELGVGEVYTELLPEDKVKVCEMLSEQMKGKEKLAFVGDGINDAPVLTRSDVGIAMGAIGSDAAVEAADVVIMDDNPKKVARAITLARRCMRIVYQNIVFAIGAKLVCLILGASGIADMWTAIFADVGVMVLCVINAVRILRVKNI